MENEIHTDDARWTHIDVKRQTGLLRTHLNINRAAFVLMRWAASRECLVRMYCIVSANQWMDVRLLRSDGGGSHATLLMTENMHIYRHTCMMCALGDLIDADAVRALIDVSGVKPWHGQVHPPPD